MVIKLFDSQKHRDGIMFLTYYVCHHGNTFSLINCSPLHLAVYFDIPWLVEKYIKDTGGSMVHAVCMTNDTPLVWGAEMGSLTCVRKLLEAGANPNAYELDGWSALHWAG